MSEKWLRAASQPCASTMRTAVEEKRKDQPQVPSILQQGTGQLAPAWHAWQVLDACVRKDEGSSGWSKGQASLVVSNPIHGSS